MWAGITLEIVKRTSPHSFQVIRRRWIVERTFGWLMRYRRLARDYERRPGHHEAMVYWATVFIMTKRLARYETRQPNPPRWGGPRPRPAPQPALSTGSYVTWPTPGAAVAALWLPAASRNVERQIRICLLNCAPTATRTRDLLLRRHFRSVAGWCRMWPDVPVDYSGNGWMRLGVAQYL